MAHLLSFSLFLFFLHLGAAVSATRSFPAFYELLQQVLHQQEEQL
jgi:hypothetical protein